MKLLNNLNLFQTLAFVGLIFTVVTHIILLVIEKSVNNFWALYPTWVLVFLFGSIVKKYIKDEDHHH